MKLVALLVWAQNLNLILHILHPLSLPTTEFSVYLLFELMVLKTQHRFFVFLVMT
jgi:hypothetical protein